MNTETRNRLATLVAEKLITALESPNPSASVIREAIKLLTSVDSGAVKAPELAAEERERRQQQPRQLPFPGGDEPTTRSPVSPSSLDGLPFTKDTKTRKSEGKSLGS